jgi:hypothetical protein
MQETVTNELLKFFLYHRGTNPWFRGKDLALSRHQRKVSATAAARKGRRWRKRKANGGKGGGTQSQRARKE